MFYDRGERLCPVNWEVGWELSSKEWASHWISAVLINCMWQCSHQYSLSYYSYVGALSSIPQKNSDIFGKTLLRGIVCERLIRGEKALLSKLGKPLHIKRNMLVFYLHIKKISLWSSGFFCFCCNCCLSSAILKDIWVRKRRCEWIWWVTIILPRKTWKGDLDV